MRSSGRLLIGLALAIAAVLAGIYVGYQRSPASVAAVTPVDKASIGRLFATEWRDADGATVSFERWRGKTLVVNFWATWCPPCREEMPGFSALQTKFAANGVQFVGIALDTAENVREFAKHSSLSYPLVIGDAEGADLARELGNATLALPYTLVIGPAGDARFSRLGAISERELESLLRPMTGS